MKKSVAFVPYFAIFGLLLFVIACGQNTPEAVFSRGMQDFENGNFVTASIHFDDFVTQYPDHELALSAYDRLAQSHMNLRDFISARRVFEAIQERFPSNAVILQCSAGIGQTYMAEGNFDAATRSFESIVDAATETMTLVESYLSLAGIKSQQQLVDEAVAYVDKIHQYADEEINDPTETVNLKFLAYESTAEIYSASQMFDKARAQFAAALDLAENATGFIGAPDMKERSVVNWAHTWVMAQDYISAATTYDRLYNNTYVRDEMKPQVIVWKIQSLERLFQEDDGEWSDPEKAVLVHEHSRFINDYDNTNYGINARIRIAGLVKDTTPEMANTMIDEAVKRLQQQVAEPLSVEAGLQAQISIFQAYMTIDKLDEAEQVAQQLKTTYSDVDQVVMMSNQMLQSVEQQRAALSAAPENTSQE